MKMEKYPAIFSKEENGYFVQFPDLDIVTEGETIEEAKKMAGDLLHMWLSTEDMEINAPSTLESVQETTDDLVFLIEPKVYVSRDAKIYMANEIIESSIKEKMLKKYQVAENLNIDIEYLNKIIALEEIPTEELAKKMAKLLDFDWRIFFSLDDEE